MGHKKYPKNEMITLWQFKYVKILNMCCYCTNIHTHIYIYTYIYIYYIYIYCVCACPPVIRYRYWKRPVYRWSIMIHLKKTWWCSIAVKFPKGKSLKKKKAHETAKKEKLSDPKTNMNPNKQGQITPGPKQRPMRVWRFEEPIVGGTPSLVYFIECIARRPNLYNYTQNYTNSCYIPNYN